MKRKFWVVWRKNAKAASTENIIDKEEAIKEVIRLVRKNLDTYYLLESVCIYAPELEEISIKETII